jgi:ABC-type dipeptide/oligopeptide/nickel transport system permease subunit
MAIKSSWDSSVGLLARRPRTIRMCSVDARSEAQPSHPTMRRRCPSRDWRGAWKKVCQIILAVSLLSVVACAGPEPMLRSNAKVQLQGREAAKLEVAACQHKAEAAGLKPGTGSRSGNVAAGAGLGLISGAAVGASTGLIGGVAGVTIGAAVGGALGVIIGSVGGAYRPLEPDPPYADAVVRCLIEKGYDVTGWQ